MDSSLTHIYHQAGAMFRHNFICVNGSILPAAACTPSMQAHHLNPARAWLPRLLPAYLIITLANSYPGRFLNSYPRCWHSFPNTLAVSFLPWQANFSHNQGE